MHRRFDDIQFKLFMVNGDIMIQFGLLHKKIDQIDTQLAQIRVALGSNYNQLQYTLGSISQSVSHLGRQVLDQETRRATKSLTDIIDPILYNINNGYMTDTEFSKLSSQLLAAIHRGVQQKEVAGNLANLSDSEVVKWQPTRDSVQWANYQINSVRAYAAAEMRRPVGKEVGNPLLLTYMTLALLLINRRRYSTSFDPLALHVSITEMDAIKKVVIEVDEANKALVPLQDPGLYLTLFRSIKTSAQAFGNAYEDEIKAFQTNKGSELDLDTSKARTHQQVIDVERFDAQKIEPGYQGPNWFWSRRDVCGEGYNSNPTASTDSENARITHVQAIKNDMVAYAQKYKAQKAQIIYPAEGYEGPLLPITLNIVESIIKQLPNKTKHALELNTLQLQFRYFTQDNREFHLQACVDSDVCYEVNLSYKMPLYNPGETEWSFWVGGLSPTGEVIEHVIRQGQLRPKKKTYDYWDKVFKPTLKKCEGYACACF